VKDIPANINYVNLLIDFGKAYGTKIFSALAILIIGHFVGRWISKAFDNTLRNRQLEPPVRILLVRLVNITILFFALLLAVHNIGVEIMPIVASLGVACRCRHRSRHPPWVGYFVTAPVRIKVVLFLGLV
jgi:small-conductance mechanosensitive channel